MARTESSICGVTSTPVKTIKDTKYSLSKEQLISLKRQFKDIKISIMPCYGIDAKDIERDLNHIDLIIDHYLDIIDNKS